MPKISLTDFVDFVTSAGTRKLAKVRTVKNRPKYLPAFDYWRNLRINALLESEAASFLQLGEAV